MGKKSPEDCISIMYFKSEIKSDNKGIILVLLVCSCCFLAERTLQCSVNAKDPVQISDCDGEFDHASKGS